MAVPEPTSPPRVPGRAGSGDRAESCHLNGIEGNLVFALRAPPGAEYRPGGGADSRTGTIDGSGFRLDAEEDVAAVEQIYRSIRFR